MKILITGASKGIGFETAYELAIAGHEVLAIARSQDQLEKLKSSILDQKNTAKIHILKMDLQQIDQDQLLAQIRAMQGLDVLINNAGLLINKPFLELSEQDWQQSFEVNFFANVRLIRLLLPHLEESFQAHIVNIGSMGGYAGSSKYPGLSAYSASKAALANLTECLAHELSSQKIAVNCLALGAVQTEMLENAFPGYQAPVNSQQMGAYVAHFCTHGQQLFSGKIIPVSRSNP
ncbi:MAG: SDR family oxidoreductase [Saprospiraceae bacterium]